MKNTSRYMRKYRIIYSNELQLTSGLQKHVSGVFKREKSPNVPMSKALSSYKIITILANIKTQHMTLT